MSDDSPNRWALFTDDELNAINSADAASIRDIEETEIYYRLGEEAMAELDRRRRERSLRK